MRKCFFSSGVLNAADYYGLDELRAACTGFADTGGGITVDTACALLASAERYIHYKCTKSLVQKVRGRYDNIIILLSLLCKSSSSHKSASHLYNRCDKHKLARGSGGQTTQIADESTDSTLSRRSNYRFRSLFARFLCPSGGPTRYGMKTCCRPPRTNPTTRRLLPHVGLRFSI